MIVKFNNKELLKILNSIFTITGISVTVIDIDRNEVKGVGNKDSYCEHLANFLGEARTLCYECDTALLEKCRKSKKMEYHICHAGLCDFAMPLIKDDVLAGYILMGRVRLKNSLYNQKYNFQDDDLLNKLFYELPVFSNEQIVAVAQLMHYILFNNAITIERDNASEVIGDYIRNNIHKKLTVDSICKEFGMSKNALYDLFNKSLNMPVNQLIIDTRVRMAKNLLLKTNKSIGRIAQEVGVGNQTYFCKMFKKETGQSPKEYRQNKR